MAIKRSKEIIAMLLAGGEGKRLGLLTRKLAKPAVPFGGKYRIIDFTLSNCSNSGIYTVGVLTQYQPMTLNSHIGIGVPWDFDRREGGVTILPPFVREQGGKWYRGTANAVYQNINFIEEYNPKYVLIISGDHIYKMDYSQMLEYHKEKGAEITIAVIEVPWEEASRFGIMDADVNGLIKEFQEKPKKPKNNLASMGIYIFDWKILRRYLRKDERNPRSSNDFGKDVIPLMLREGRRLYAYPFKGYWKDVGTIESLWKANMDLLTDNPPLDLYDKDFRIYTVNPNQPPHYLGSRARVICSMINEGCLVQGEVNHSVLFPGVQVGEDSRVKDSIIMPGVKIGKDVFIDRAIVGEGTVIGEGTCIKSSQEDPPEIILIRDQLEVPPYSNITCTLENIKDLKGGKAISSLAYGDGA